jgi:hypothetical protein
MALHVDPAKMAFADGLGDHVIPSALLDRMDPMPPIAAPPKSMRGVVGTTVLICSTIGAFGSILFTAIALQVV